MSAALESSLLVYFGAHARNSSIVLQQEQLAAQPLLRIVNKLKDKWCLHQL